MINNISQFNNPKQEKAVTFGYDFLSPSLPAFSFKII